MKNMKTTPHVRPGDTSLTVPLQPSVKQSLIARARKNGRAAGREAEIIITKAVMRAVMRGKPSA